MKIETKDVDEKVQVLTARRDQLQALISDVQEEAKAVKRREQRLLVECATIERLIEDVDLRARIDLEGNFSLTHKNINAHRAWAAIIKAFDDNPERRTLQSRILLNAVRLNIPNIKASTFRSYLLRFRKDGKLENTKHGYWSLKQAREVPKR